MSGDGGELRRRRRDTGHKPNHERWMVSYADLLTLLLALFIVLYATSAQNTSKMTQMAAGMLVAFSGTPPALVDKPSSPHGPMHSMPSPVRLPVQAPRPPLTPSAAREFRRLYKTMAQGRQRLSQDKQKDLQPSVEAIGKLGKKLRALLQTEIHAKTISIYSSPLSIKIRLNAKILFGNGAATLTDGATKILEPLAKTLRTIPKGYRISIHGYTDDKPIHTAQFPSNWQLSTARALSVVLLFRAQNVPGELLSAEGFSKYHPIASNATEAGRQQNRRVSIVISAPKVAPKKAAARHSAATPDQPTRKAQPPAPRSHNAAGAVPAAKTAMPNALLPPGGARISPPGQSDATTRKGGDAVSNSQVKTPVGAHHG